jgi:hypothetical protein
MFSVPIGVRPYSFTHFGDGGVSASEANACRADNGTTLRLTAFKNVRRFMGNSSWNHFSDFCATGVSGSSRVDSQSGILAGAKI